MKKITLLLLICFPLLSAAQAWEFNNDNGGWTGLFGTVTAGPTTTTLTINGMANQNPKFSNASAGVMAPTNNFAIITLKNNTNNGYMRFSYPKTTSGRTYKNQVISTNDTGFQTYVVDISDNTHFTGTIDDMQLIFKIDQATNADGSGGSIEIDRIEFSDTFPVLPRSAYEFNNNSDLEGWAVRSGLALSATGGNLVQDYSNVNANGQGKMSQDLYVVDASTAQYVHVVLQNGTTNDQLRVSYPDGMGARVFRSATTTTNASSFETIDIDLSGTSWTGNVANIEIQLRDSAAGATVVGGTVLIDRIIFDNNATLSNDELDTLTFSMYPNPASDVLKFQANSDITNVSIYSITGAQVYSGTPVSNTVNVSSLNDGIYMVQATSGEQTIVRKLIIK